MSANVINFGGKLYTFCNLKAFQGWFHDVYLDLNILDLSIGHFVCIYFQNDMLMSLSTQKATVNEDDLKKLEEFTSDFGQEGQRYVISVYILMFP